MSWEDTARIQASTLDCSIKIADYRNRRSSAPILKHCSEQCELEKHRNWFISGDCPWIPGSIILMELLWSSVFVTILSLLSLVYQRFTVQNAFTIKLFSTDITWHGDFIATSPTYGNFNRFGHFFDNQRWKWFDCCQNKVSLHQKRENQRYFQYDNWVCDIKHVVWSSSDNIYGDLRSNLN